METPGGRSSFFGGNRNWLYAIIFVNASVAQSVEQRFRKARVVGSIPIAGFPFYIYTNLYSGY
jgi:hypothetical protein